MGSPSGVVVTPMVATGLGFGNPGPCLQDWRCSMADPVIRGLFHALVQRAGGVDAVAAVLEARYGVGHKGTVSKMCAGAIGVTVEAAQAVEDFVGAYPITGRMFARQRDEAVSAGSICDLTEQSTLAAGAAHASLVRALSHRSAGGCSVTALEAAEIIVKAGALRDYAGRIVAEAEAVLAGVRA